MGVDIAQRIDPDWLVGLHHCDNPPCCNPDHLFLGTSADNMADMQAKGRGRLPRQVFRGEDNACARLTEQQVVTIRQLYRRGLGRQLAREYNVSDALMSLIVTGKVWAHHPEHDTNPGAIPQFRYRRVSVYRGG
jgi:hypothetical protein